MSLTSVSRKNRTSVEMYPLVEAYISSSLSRIAFCQEHNLPVSALNYWQTKYRKSMAPNPQKQSSSFLPVEVRKPESVANQALMELVLESGIRLRFYSYPDASYLESILSIGSC